MDGESTNEGDVERRVTATYVSNEQVIRREVAAVARDMEQAPGYWRGFVVRHLLTAVVAGGVVIAVGTASGTDLTRLALTLAFVLAVAAVLTGVDLIVARRRLRRVLRAWHRESCPPGTQVRADYSADTVVFGLPTHEVRLDLGTVVAARHAPGVLLLDQVDSPRSWVVPDELIGPEGLALLKDTLGDRYRRQR